MQDDMESREEQEEEIDFKKFGKDLKKIDTKVVISILFVCLVILVYLLGNMYGYREAYKGQKNYYERKIALFCYCREEANYSRIPEPLNINFGDVESRIS